MCTFLTNQEINELCDGLIIEYIKSIDAMPEYVDIDAFATEFMHLKVRYEHFIKTDPPCLGCIGNGETGFAVVKDGRAACVFFEKNEMVADIIKIDLDDGFSFELKSIQPIRDDDEYQGLRVALFANYPPMQMRIMCI